MNGTNSAKQSRIAGKKLKPEGISQRVLTLKEAAVYLGISVTRLREFAHWDKVTYIKYPHPYKANKQTQKILFDIADLDEFIERNKVPSVESPGPWKYGAQ